MSRKKIENLLKTLTHGSEYPVEELPKKLLKEIQKTLENHRNLQPSRFRLCQSDNNLIMPNVHSKSCQDTSYYIYWLVFPAAVSPHAEGMEPDEEVVSLQRNYSQFLLDNYHPSTPVLCFNCQISRFKITTVGELLPEVENE